MNVKLEEMRNGWRADCLDLPGSPPCGDGTTKEMAIACLFFRLLNESKSFSSVEWVRYIKLNEPLIINGEEYKSPYTNAR